MAKEMDGQNDEQQTRPSARRALWGINALLGAGVLAYLSTISPQPAPAAPTPARQQPTPTQQQPTPALTTPALPTPVQPAHAMPVLTPQQTTTPPSYALPVITPQQTPAQTQPLRTTSARDLRIAGYDAYNALVPTIEQVALTEGVPADILALIVLNESKGKDGTRHEPGFEARYVRPLLEGMMDTEQKSKRLTLEGMLAKQLASGKAKDKDEFANKLATSYGPAQIMYLVAVERGFRGSAEELADPRTNITFAAKRVKAHMASTSTPDPAAPARRVYDWRKVLIDYNSGSVNGTPHPGYLERGTVYARKLGL